MPTNSISPATKVLFIVLFAALSSISVAQSADDYQEALTTLQQRYNVSQYGQIYTMFDQDMKSVLSLDNTKSFFEGIESAFGSLESFSFLRDNPPFRQYKGVFADGDLSIDLSLNREGLINGLRIVPLDGDDEVFKSSSVSLDFLSKGDWYVFWGGNTVEQNYHITNRAQRHALDLVVRDGAGQSHRGDGSQNADYYAYGKKIFSPADGKVVFAVDGVPDNTPGVMNTNYVPGNSVLLEIADGEFLLLAHFLQGSVAVKSGDTVKRGELLGKCGNSGNSSEPHIHIHIQDTSVLSDGSGIELRFAELAVDGEVKTDYAPVKGQIISRP